MGHMRVSSDTITCESCSQNMKQMTRTNGMAAARSINTLWSIIWTELATTPCSNVLSVELYAMASPAFSARNVPDADESLAWLGKMAQAVRQANDLEEILPRLYSVLQKAGRLAPKREAPWNSTVRSLSRSVQHSIVAYINTL